MKKYVLFLCVIQVVALYGMEEKEEELPERKRNTSQSSMIVQGELSYSRASDDDSLKEEMHFVSAQVHALSEMMKKNKETQDKLLQTQNALLHQLKRITNTKEKKLEIYEDHIKFKEACLILTLQKEELNMSPGTNVKSGIGLWALILGKKEELTRISAASLSKVLQQQEEKAKKEKASKKRSGEETARHIKKKKTPRTVSARGKKHHRKHSH